MNHGGRFARQHLLGFVDLLAFQRGEPLSLVDWKNREELQEAADVGVLGVAPELPVIVGAHHIRIEPDRAGGGLAHLGARARGDERRGQREQLRVEHAPAELDAVDDVAPLIGAAHLQHAAVSPVELDEVVGLEDHVVEFQERQLLLAVEPQLDRFEAEHAVDRKMPAHLAQEIDVIERVEPVGIVGHDGVARAAAELQELVEHRADAAQVSGDHRLVEQFAAFVLAGGIADPRGAAAHQRDRPVPGLLHPVQHHDRHQVADVERRGGAIESDIAGDARRLRQGVECLGFRDLVDEAPRREHAQEFGFIGAHRRALSRKSPARQLHAGGPVV